MRSVSRITRMTVAGSLALTAVVSAVAARGFTGRARTSTDPGGTTTLAAAGGGSSGQRVALPPRNGGTLSAPASLPVSQSAPAPPPITSGGS